MAHDVNHPALRQPSSEPVGRHPLPLSGRRRDVRQQPGWFGDVDPERHDEHADLIDRRRRLTCQPERGGDRRLHLRARLQLTAGLEQASRAARDGGQEARR
jgi:hypothetical protein